MLTEKNRTGSNCVIYPGVKLGKNVRISDFCVIGIPPEGKEKDRAGVTVIGDNAIIRPFTSIYAGVKVGSSFRTGHGAFIREGNRIGNNVSVGTNTSLQPGNTIGDNTRIHAGCFLERVRVGNGVFIGPCTVFTDDLHPPCPEYERCMPRIRVRDGAKIGANVTILPGIVIGKNALVGAGSVVTKNIRDGIVAAGCPAADRGPVRSLKCRKGFFRTPYDWEKAAKRRGCK